VRRQDDIQAIQTLSSESGGLHSKFGNPETSRVRGPHRTGPRFGRARRARVVEEPALAGDRLGEAAAQRFGRVPGRGGHAEVRAKLQLLPDRPAGDDVDDTASPPLAMKRCRRPDDLHSFHQLRGDGLQVPCHVADRLLGNAIYQDQNPAATHGLTENTLALYSEAEAGDHLPQGVPEVVAGQRSLRRQLLREMTVMEAGTASMRSGRLVPVTTSGSSATVSGSGLADCSSPQAGRPAWGPRAGGDGSGLGRRWRGWPAQTGSWPGSQQSLRESAPHVYFLATKKIGFGSVPLDRGTMGRYVEHGGNTLGATIVQGDVGGRDRERADDRHGRHGRADPAGEGRAGRPGTGVQEGSLLHGGGRLRRDPVRVRRAPQQRQRPAAVRRVPRLPAGPTRATSTTFSSTGGQKTPTTASRSSVASRIISSTTLSGVEVGLEMLR
jgi:hypothetical protein